MPLPTRSYYLIEHPQGPAAALRNTTSDPCWWGGDSWVFVPSEAIKFVSRDEANRVIDGVHWKDRDQLIVTGHGWEVVDTRAASPEKGTPADASEFTAAILREHFANQSGGVDGDVMQDLGAKHGVMVKVMATEPCGESCSCEGFDFPVECYRIAVRTAPGISPPAKPSTPTLEAAVARERVVTVIYGENISTDKRARFFQDLDAYAAALRTVPASPPPLADEPTEAMIEAAYRVCLSTEWTYNSTDVRNSLRPILRAALRAASAGTPTREQIVLAMIGAHERCSTSCAGIVESSTKDPCGPCERQLNLYASAVAALFPPVEPTGDLTDD